MRRQSLNTLIAAAILLSPAHADSQRVTDSSGVRIVLYSAPSAEVRLSTPVLTVSDDGCELNRVSGLVLQSSGDIVVGNGGNKEICVFDRGGKFSRRIGREGEGPGEFRRLSPIQAGRGDSIVIVDDALRRVTIFGPEGGKGRSFNIAAPDPALGSRSATVALADGSILLGFSEFIAGAPRPDALMFEQRLFRVGPMGEQLGRLGRFPIREHFIFKTIPERGGVGYFTLAFGRSLEVAATPTGFIAGDGSDFSLREFSIDGTVRAIHRVDRQRQPVTKADIDSYRVADLAGAKGAELEFGQRLLDAMPYPSHYPAYRRLLTDDANGIWIELSPTQGSRVSRWMRLDPSRESARTFRFPDRFRLFAIRGGRACGVTRDDVDLETISCVAIPR